MGIELINGITNINANMYEFQIEALQYMLEHHYCINAFDMGLGKSLISIALIASLDKKALIICPASLKHNWKKEIEKFSNKTCAYTTKKSELYTDKSLHNKDIVILNYEQLDSAKEFFVDRTIVICDEATALKNPLTNRTQLFNRYLDHYAPERLVLLSGTPIKNRVSELWSYLFMLAKSKHRTNGIRLNDTAYRSYYAFCNYFSHAVVRYVPAKVTTYEGVRNVEELHKLLEHKYIKRDAKDVLDLPEYSRLEIEAETFKKYDKLEQELAADWQRFESKKGGSMSTAKRDLAVVKVSTTIDLACSILERDEKLVIFSDHVEPCHLIADKLKKSGFSCGVITGETHIKERNNYVDDFQERDLDCLILTIGAGGTGLTLTAANNMIFNDLPWVPANLEQAERRIHRIGQTKKCFYYTVTYGKLDKMISATIKNKLITIDKVIK